MEKLFGKIRRLLAALCVAMSAIALCAVAGESAAATPYPYSVGEDPSCDYDSIQQAIDAAAANPGPDQIAVAVNRNFSAQALVIGQQDLIIEGGWAECYYAENGGTPQPGQQTTISGLGGSQAPVFAVSGSGVREFHNLFITGGDNVSGDGGGIRFNGIGAIVLRNTAVANNQANRGAGIFAQGGSGTTLLELKNDTLIINNRAGADGGGIFIAGSAHLRMHEAPATLYFNRALNGRGGALYVRGPASASIQSTGYNGLAPIEGNNAVDGGGIALVAGDNHGDNPALYMIGVQTGAPLGIKDNIASARGGAIYALADGNALPSHYSRPYAFLDNTNVVGNRAADGAAFFVDADEFNFGTNAIAGQISFGLHDNGNRSVRCKSTPVSVPDCNLIERNETNGAGGSVVYVQADGVFKAGGATIRNNRAVRLLRADGSDGEPVGIELKDSLIVANILDESLLLLSGGEDRAELRGLTVVGNDLLNTDVLFRAQNGGARFSLSESVIDQILDPVTLVHPGGPASSNIHSAHNLGVSALSANDASSIAAPARFVDVNVGDYRLRPGSQGIDLAPAMDGDQFDLDAQNASKRDLDQTLTLDREGPRDAGAYELSPTVNLLTNPNFRVDLRAWEPVALPSGVQVRFDSLSADAGSGSAEISLPPGHAVSEAVGLRHCAFIPVGAGSRFELGGRAYTGFIDPASHDRAVLEWVYRRDSDEGCNGAISAQGELVLPVGAWATPSVLADIETPGAHANSSIEIRLKVRRNAGEDPASGDLFARFDGLFLRPGLFRDGFEQ